MIIGNFTYDREHNSFAGSVRTLTIVRDNIVLKPLQKTGDKAPDYRVLAQWGEGGVDIGAGWRRSSENGRGFISVVLDDPALHTPISAAMFLAADETTATLVWSRTKAREAIPDPAHATAKQRRKGRAKPGDDGVPAPA